ncbi:hypothetical protein N7510_001294 [Penicillium lagena]|uniref:uncharacterized protein n=1 Tax=Penicillium lagena TaxID=94218 RepID=UPI0025426A48|nr:uncharacterized protein N7510_001294 [Penicillium lagena]KAJ5624985.1 hypothetical protein N7510_001294 [Penicillium lagena]
MPDATAHKHGLNACEKVVLHHSVSSSLTGGSIRTDQMLLLKPSWLLCSEAAWNSMEPNYNALSRPSFHRRDRFWLAPDHIVDPRVNHKPREKAVIEKCERIAREMELGDNYNPPNTTIMHTDFYRKRCQPGQLVIGADSHTSSAGGLGALAVGMGGTDVLMQIVTGETFIKMPEVICIQFVGRPPLGLGGKDVILGVLGQLRRNTVASERFVEFTGEGMKYLSCDARFAICNMVTEFGGIGALAVPDAVTADFISRRPERKHKSEALFFRPDKNARYAGEYQIDLSKLEHFVALYPSPDNVIPVSQANIPEIQGCFIGACTTTEEDLILGGLVLREGLKAGLDPVARGIRRVTPGSIAITEKLRRIGLIDVYERAGFVVGAPGCSYCVGMGADKAGNGEVWLSSQNRNYRDRMGPGSIANLASAATVAASSFSMSLRSPQSLLNGIDFNEYDRLRNYSADSNFVAEHVTYVEPFPTGRAEILSQNSAVHTPSAEEAQTSPSLPNVIQGNIQRFGDSIDTDSIAPTEICLDPTPEKLAHGAFLHRKPDFYDLAQAGATILVAGSAFGTGSSREQAPKALIAAGIKAVIAKSFAFIYGRNQANNGLLGIKVQHDRFYDLAQEGIKLTIDVQRRVIECKDVQFHFYLDPIEESLLAAGGLLKMYNLYGSTLFKNLQDKTSSREEISYHLTESGNSKLEW